MREDLGEQTKDILGELGYSAEAIDELIKSGAAIDMDPALRD